MKKHRTLCESEKMYIGQSIAKRFTLACAKAAD